MEFKNEIGLIQRRMAASIAGTSRRLEILNALKSDISSFNKYMSRMLLKSN